jgi:ribose transport system permease protein
MAGNKGMTKSDNATGGFWKKIKGMRELNLILIIVLAMIIMGLTNEYFFTWTNLRVLLSSMAIDGIVVIGMTLILIVGGIDLSVGSVLVFSMTVCALLFTGGMNPWLAALIAIACSAGIGWIMGMLVTKLKLSHFIVTLAFMGMIRGLVLILSTGTPLSVVSELAAAPIFQGLGQGKLFGTGSAFPTQLPIQVIIFIVIAIIADYIVRHSSAMRVVFYTGSNPKAAEYSGINTDRVVRTMGIVCSTLAGLAGIIYLSKFSGVPMSAGSGLEMTAISSAVIGGASLTGGRGTVFGAILGLAIMQLSTNALSLYSVSTFWYDFIKFSILLLAVVLDQVQRVISLRKTT